MLILEILILFALLIIVVEDFQSRSVHWILFPLIGTLLVLFRVIRERSISIIWHDGLINFFFIIIQILILSIYFSVKNKTWINITKGWLGMGDIFFLFAIAPYFSVLNFLFFYMGSLIIILVMWLVTLNFLKSLNKYVPLAGFQAIMLFFILILDWWFLSLNLTSDEWLLRILN